jgi:hypothetical protein
MGLSDSPHGRSQATAMRDLLRQLDREINASRPARPTAPPSFALAAAPASMEVRIGSWTLTEDGATGDLLAVDSNGATYVLAQKGTN